MSFLCKICSYFEENLCMSTRKRYLKRDSKIGYVSEFCELFRNNYFVRGSLFNKFASLAT